MRTFGLATGRGRWGHSAKRKGRREADALRHVFDDCEMGPRWRRSFEQEALHGAADDDSRNRAGGASLSEDMEEASLIQNERRREDDDENRRRRDEKKELASRQQRAIHAILKAKNASELMEKIETEIEEDWVGDVNDLPGNIYSIAGMGEMALKEQLFSSFKDENGKILKEADPQEWVMERARWLGFLCIMFIQIIGPPAIFLSAWMTWGIMSEDKIHWDRWHPLTEPDLYDWSHIALTKLLATVFILCFILNSVFVLMDEHKTWIAIDKTFAYLHQNDAKDGSTDAADKFHLSGQIWISVGAVVNCWVVLWCCLDSFVVIGASGSPKNVLFDALGLIFLYNLDDTSGDLGFVAAEDWPGTRFHWIYKFVKEGKGADISNDGTRSSNQRRPSVHGQDNKVKKLDDIEISWQSYFVNKLFLVTEILLVIMAFCLPTLAALTSFSRLMEDLG